MSGFHNGWMGSFMLCLTSSEMWGYCRQKGWEPLQSIKDVEVYRWKQAELKATLSPFHIHIQIRTVLTPSSALVSPPERIQRFYSALSTMKNLPMIHKSYMNIQIMYIWCEPQDWSISMLLLQQICSILRPQVCPTLCGSRRFTTLAVIIVRFKKSSSSGVKWELDRARARINETIYANERAFWKYGNKY